MSLSSHEKSLLTLAELRIYEEIEIKGQSVAVIARQFEVPSQRIHSLLDQAKTKLLANKNTHQ